MRYVVTGGAGFVGSNLTKLLVKEGHDVLVIDNLVKGKKETSLKFSIKLSLLKEIFEIMMTWKKTSKILMEFFIKQH